MKKWHLKGFEELQIEEFYKMIALRIEVFIIEQNCPYQELDGKDQKSQHLICEEGGEIIATARIVGPGVSYQEPSIGRVVITEEARGSGLGHELMRQAMAASEKMYGNRTIRLSAQEYLINFYKKHRFEVVSDVYLEDNIPHVEMLFTPKNDTQ
ncbi:GNAT family N-acetyltransferase [Flavobacteriales bacterium]|jgi:ElaA protein|nr:GNAT family N-acetyltransferase [Flavobacteriales bacterium]